MNHKTIGVVILSLLANMSAQAIQPERGYRGMVEWSSDIKADIPLYGGPSDSRFYTGVSISQGYQFNRWLYAGGGVSVEQCVKDNSIYSAPIFGQVRTDFKFNRFTPFIDARIGYNFANYGGIYFSPSVGYRINWGKPVSINIGIGWSMTGNRNNIKTVTEILGPNGMGGTNTTWHRVHQYDDTLTLRLGIEF